MILARYRGGAPRAYTWGGSRGEWRQVEASGLFGRAQRRSFRHEQRLDADGLVDRIASVSFVAALPDARRREALREVRQLAASVGSPVRLAYVTEGYAYRRLPGPER